MIALSEPSGDKLQLQLGSICGADGLFPLLTSNRNVSQVLPFTVVYMQMVDGKRAHSTIAMPTSLSTRRGGPPPIGTARIAEGDSGPADLGVETYKISDPSGVILGCDRWSAPVTRRSANGSSMACLKISRVPLRFELNRIALLSGVQATGIFSFSSRVSRRVASNLVPSVSSVPK